MLTVSIVLLTLGILIFYPEDLARLAEQIFYSLLFVQNFYMWNEVDYFSPGIQLQPFMHSWSLSIEEQFYLTWPLLIMLTHRLFGSIQKYIFWVFLVFILIYGSIISHLHTDLFSYYSPVVRFFEILAGSLLAINFKSILHSISPFFRQISTLVGLVVIAVGYWVINQKNFIYGFTFVIPVLATLLVLIGDNNSLGAKLLKNRFLVYSGNISYSVYLWHWPLLSTLLILSSWEVSDKDRIFVLALAFGMGALTYHFIENPIRKTAEPLRRNRAIKVLILSLIVALICQFILIERGFPNRFKLNQIPNFENVEYPKVFSIKGKDCGPIHATPETQNLYCHLSSPEPKYLFIGDSHATAMYGAIYNKKSNIQAALLAADACLPFPKLNEFQIKQVDQECVDILSYARKIIDTYPTITDVVIVNRASSYLIHESFGIEAIGDPFFQRERVEISFEDYQSGLRYLIQFLKNWKLNIIVSADVPELGFSPAYCNHQINSMFEKSSLTKCSIEREKVEMRKTPIRSIIKNLTFVYPELRIYDPLNAFCSTALCYGLSSTNEALYIDTHHLSDLGSEKLLKHFENWADSQSSH